MLTCDYRDQAPSELLTLILKDTGLACRWSEGGRAVIYPLPDHEVFTVEGFIASPNGTLPGATLEVLGSARVTTTDSRGAFSLTRLPRRRLQLRIGAEGYAQMTLEVKPERDRQPVSVLLAERPFLAEHLVVSKPFGDSEGDSIGGKLRISRPEEVIRHGTTSHDLFQGLRAIPGVDAGSREGGVSFRGARPSENLVLLEGIKLYQLDHALGHFSALNPDALGEVHIFKGAYPARYGNRVAGVMDIRAKGDLLGTREIRAGTGSRPGPCNPALPHRLPGGNYDLGPPISQRYDGTIRLRTPVCGYLRSGNRRISRSWTRFGPPAIFASKIRCYA